MPVKQLAGRRVASLAAGHSHSLAVQATRASEDRGCLWAWGANSSGQLGLGRRSAKEPSPQRVATLQGAGVLQVYTVTTCASALSLFLNES